MESVSAQWRFANTVTTREATKKKGAAFDVNAVQRRLKRAEET
jgi:hypothetical protein